jgi:hypothetical protein
MRVAFCFDCKCRIIDPRFTLHKDGRRMELCENCMGARLSSTARPQPAAVNAAVDDDDDFDDAAGFALGVGAP